MILDNDTVRVRLDKTEDIDLTKPNDLDKDIEVFIMTVIKDIEMYR